MPWNPTFDYGFVLSSDNNASHNFMLNCSRLALAIAQEAIAACELTNGSLDHPQRLGYYSTVYSAVPYSYPFEYQNCNPKKEIAITTLFAETLSRAVNCLVTYLEWNGYNQCYIKENHSMPKSEVAGISVASVFGGIITAAVLLSLCLATLYLLSRRLNPTSVTPITGSLTEGADPSSESQLLNPINTHDDTNYGASGSSSLKI